MGRIAARASASLHLRCSLILPSNLVFKMELHLLWRRPLKLTWRLFSDWRFQILTDCPSSEKSPPPIPLTDGAAAASKVIHFGRDKNFHSLGNLDECRRRRSSSIALVMFPLLVLRTLRPLFYGYF